MRVVLTEYITSSKLTLKHGLLGDTPTVVAKRLKFESRSEIKFFTSI